MLLYVLVSGRPNALGKVSKIGNVYSTQRLSRFRQQFTGNILIAKIMGTSRNSKSGQNTQSTFLLEERPAKVSPSRDSEKDWMIRVATWRSSFWELLTVTAPHGFFGRTCPASIPLGQMNRCVRRVRNAKILLTKLDDLEGSSELTQSQRLAIAKLRKLIKPVILTASSPAWSNSATGSRQQFLTLNTEGWRNGASVCSLSAVLEDNGSVPQRFYLTGRACAGILRRAARRGKELPQQLRAALTQVAQAGEQTFLRGGGV